MLYVVGGENKTHTHIHNGALLAEANLHYTNLTHQCLLEPDKITKETCLVPGTVTWRVRIVHVAFDATNQVQI